MVIFKILLVNLQDNQLEEHFWKFIDENEICTVQASFQYSERYNGYELEMIPESDDEISEFLELSGELVNHLKSLDYNI